VSSDLLPPSDLGHGISVIPLPLPFPSPRTVNAYVLEGPTGLTVLDCGVDWQPGHDALETGFTDLGLDGGSVDTLVITHLHPDHAGMVPRLREEWGCRVVMHTRSEERRHRYNDTDGYARRTADLAARHGTPEDLRPAFGDVGARPSFMPILGPADHLVEDGDRIPLGGDRHLDVLHTPGHEPTHICLVDSRTGILFSGDHILPRITPVIMHDESASDPLGDYLESLRRLADRHVGLTYPAHGSIIERGTLRAEQITLHHERRLSGMVDVLDRGPATAWQVMEAVYRPHLTVPEQRLALSETVAHLEHLCTVGTASTFEEDGIVWFRRT
jgi:glyoxylase-like metal-dependent hydrolase (beta-lactamase superfamily II)